MSELVVIFDLDGIISDTASVHAMAWKAVFDQVLAQDEYDHTPFSVTEDYAQYVDGKSRQVGIESFLHSRGIKLDTGVIDDESLHCMHGIGNQKNTLFRKILSESGVRIFDDAKNLIQTLIDNAATLAIASSSKNARAVLESGGLLECFSVIMDGVTAEEHNIKSKPNPDFYAHAAFLLGQEPAQCSVIEDATSGIASAKDAGIGTVIGVARNQNNAKLSEFGADIVVESLNELTLVDLRARSNNTPWADHPAE